MKKYRNIILFFICISVLIVVVIIAKSTFSNKEKEELKNSNQFYAKKQEDVNTIENIKNEINATADTNMYQVEEEYDGRKIIQIKPNIQYDTVLAGILKNSIPKESEIEEILKDRPLKSGIWVSKQSTDAFLKLLKENGINEYQIGKDGYLTKKDDNAKNEKLNQAINSNKLFIIDISGKCYERDDITGKIIEYPFEEMDPDQPLELYSVDNSSILEVTLNKKNILTNKEILKSIIDNID